MLPPCPPSILALLCHHGDTIWKSFKILVVEALDSLANFIHTDQSEIYFLNGKRNHVNKSSALEVEVVCFTIEPTHSKVRSLGYVVIFYLN